MTDGTQVVLTLYGGDIQIDTPQDQGPIQNAAVDKGAVPVALRSNYVDATSASYFVDNIVDAYQDLIAPELAANPNAKFVGIVGTGDYKDKACDQEQRRFVMIADQLSAIDPSLYFFLLVNGNHDGGQFMGNVWSSHNFVFLRFVYPDMVTDNMNCLCGEAEFIHERHEAVEESYAVIENHAPNQSGEIIPFSTILEDVRRGSRHSFRKEDGKIPFKDTERAYAELWTHIPGSNRYSARIHYDGMNYDPKNYDDYDNESGKRISEFSSHPGDAKEWIDLQAAQVADFETDEAGKTVPVYQIALDTMDLTGYGDAESAVFGHMSQFQVSAVESFMDHMLSQNPNAKFKLVTHHPIYDLVCSSKSAYKRLLEREEVVLVVDAHVHERGFDEDITKEYHLDRKTALARLTIPSSTDEPREVVAEKMTLVKQEEGKYNLQFEFDHHRLTEDDIASPETDVPVYEAADELEQILIDNKKQLYEEFTQKGIKTKKLTNDAGEPKWIYLNEDEVIAQLKDPLLKRIANGKAHRDMQVWTALKMFYSLGGGFSRKLTAEISIKDMQLDFEATLPYLDLIVALLKEEGFEDRASDLERRVVFAKAYYQTWLMDYNRRVAQNFDDDGLRIYNNLYTTTKLDEMYNVIMALPDELYAKKFAMIVGMRASEEEARYHGLDNSEAAKVPDHIVVNSGSFYL